MTTHTTAARRHVEVLVVGAGPAGMAAATAAANRGRKVVVLDDNPAAGGQIWREGTGATKRDAVREKIRDGFRRSGAALFCGHTVVDAPEKRTLTSIAHIGGKTEQHSFSWNRLILATGARERLLPFPGWTLPGVFGAGGLQALVKGGYAVSGKRIIVAGTGPLLLAVAVHLQEAGAKIIGLFEQAPLTQLLPFAAHLRKHPAKAMQGLRYRSALSRVPYKLGSWPVAVRQSAAGMAVDLSNGHRTWTEDCDLLACGFHLVGNTELASLLGCDLSGDFVAVDDRQQTSVPNIFCAGEPTGIAGLDAALVQGEIAGLAASGTLLTPKNLLRRQEKELKLSQRLNKAFTLRSEILSLAAPETIVCRCEDVRFEQLQPYASRDASPHELWTEAKLQTRCGMGPCQGRICGPAVQALFGWKQASVRPPLFPVPVGAFTNSNPSHSNGFVTLQETP